LAKLRGFFRKEDLAAIISAIEHAETRTSGEIRVRVERKGGNDPLKKAMIAFEKLGMKKTSLRNGILFYVSLQDRKFAILGDNMINAKVPKGFWDIVKNAVVEKFREKQFAIGLVGGINLAGEKLAEYFPLEKDDKNELPNAISFEDEDVKK